MIGHGPFKRLLWKMNLSNDYKYRMCDFEQETAEHILCDCVALSRKRYNLFGADSMELAEFTNVELSKILILTNCFNTR